ncbi:MAG TPA: sulfotransferase, partial [Rudaea sp.]|nr:sulfotransferase [Rudaea sp.]
MSDAVPRIPAFDRFAGAVGARWPGMLRRLAALETRSVRAAIDGVAIDRPVYICGLARAGSTLLLELLAQAPGFTAHRYADYPLLWMPYWWNRLRAQLPLPPQAPVERAHRDRIAVTRESPEAFEEVFWMHFFPGRHDPAVDQVLDASCSCQEFTTFYLDHVRKLLAVRGARRYLAKGNYNLARLGLLRAIFPDARFVVAIREPLAHVASLVKQDRLFGAWSAADPAIARQLARGGHYEFG